METKAYMYVLECADGSLYTGYTTDVEKRLKTHNAGKGAKYTRARLPVKLLYKESYPDKPSAMSAEALFKRNRARQTKLYQKPSDSIVQRFFIYKMVIRY